MAEMLVAVTIMVIITAVVASLFAQVRKMVSITQWNAETRARLRTTIDELAHDLQNIDNKAYFIMLNRDYGTYDPAVDPKTNPPSLGCQVYPGPVGVDVTPTQKRLAADRIAFVANGPFNTPQNLQTSANPNPAAMSARVYYGHSLYTHDIADTWWRAQFALGNGNIAPPLLTPPWPADCRNRPAVNWEFVRQAVLHVQDPAADPSPDPVLCVPGPIPTLSSRLNNDYEYRMLHSSIDAYTPEDLTRWISTQLGAIPPQIDWAALLWAPRVRQYPDGAKIDMDVAPGRLLVPHAARVRFQVRLSDGTILPKIHDDPTDDNMWLRGALLDIATRASDGAVSITGMNPSFNIDKPVGVYSPLGSPSSPPQRSVYDVDTAAPIPMLQFGYVWSGNRSYQTPGNTLYPVALRVRMDVYDPQKRTPDPIRVDEWLPIRWQR